MTDAAQAGKFKKALKLYKELPESMRSDRTIMITRLTAAQQVGETEYQAALDDWETLFPGDPSLDLLMIDSLYAKGRLDDLIQVLSRLSDRLGGDAWSDYLAGSVRLQQEKIAEARQAADKCIEAEPGLKEGRFLLLAVSLKQKDHALTAKTLTVLADEFGVPVGDLSAEPGYEDFVTSKEYEAWKASRSK
jgi:tetratricopeptide (TPR) repeat protein